MINFATKLSAATGALYKLNKHIPKSALMAVYTIIVVYSHLQYAITCWGNTAKNKICKQ